MANPKRRNFLAGSGALAAALFAPAAGFAKEQNVLSDFLAAVVAGDTDKVNALLDQNNALLYARDSKGQSAYLLAAYAKRAEVIKIFESRNIVLDVYEAAAAARVDRLKALLRDCRGLLRSTNAAGDTPLHAAARAEQSTSFENIIGYGPDFSITNPLQKQITAAHLAVACTQAEPAEAMAFAILGNGANPNALTTDKDAVLHCAARAGNVRVVKLILQKGGDSAARNAKGQTPAEIAATNDLREAQQLLERSNSIPKDYYAKRFSYDRNFNALTRDDTHGIPLDFVNAFVLYSHFGFDQIKRWTASCPDLINTRASWDELPVEAAAHMGRADVGEFLLGKGAAYSLPTAVVFGPTQDVKRMLEEDPGRIHERGAHSFPLLWYTAFGQPRLETAEYLIAQGAPVEEDMRGRTVLHTAAASGHLDLCRFFLEKGLNPRQVGDNFEGKLTAIDAAEKAKHPEVAKMLSAWPQ